MKQAVLLSRHPLTPAMRTALPGYNVEQVHPPSRFWSAADALALAQQACGGVLPALFIVVMPLEMLRDFVRLVDGRVPIIRPVLDWRCEPPRFVCWRRIHSVAVITSAWEVREVQP